MRSVSVFGLLLAGAVSGQTQQAPVDHGRLGIWYRSSNVRGIPDDNEQIVPVLERKGDVRLRPSVWRSLALPSTIAWGKYLSRQVNVDSQGQNIVGDAANEPSLAVDPNDRKRIVVGWRQFDNVASNFRQAGNAYTSDGGTTWRANTVLQPGVFRSDPVLAVDASGKF